MSNTQGNNALVARYAKALFASATQHNNVEAVEADVMRVDEMVAGSPELQRLVRSPVLSRKEQAQALAAILDKAGITGIAKKFFLVLAENRRLMLLSAIAQAFSLLASEARGEVTVKVTSASALDATQLSALATALEASLQHKLRIQAAVDPAILGGLIVQIGSTMVDDSVKSKLGRLQIASRHAIAAL